MSSRMSKTKRLFNKICGVCGGKARGRNFGAITCESCKAFFRRSMTKTNDLKCNYENNCLIDQISRIFCPKCRLDRCFEIGMRREMVVNKDVARKRQKRSDDSQTSHSSPSDDTDSHSMSDPIPDLIEDLTSHHLSSQSDDSMTVQTIDTFSVLRTKAIVLKPISTYDKPWNDLELNRLTELSVAANEFQFMRSDKSSNCIKILNLADLYQKLSSYRVYDNFVMSSIKFCKNLGLFKEVCENDKVALFRNNSFKVIFLKHMSMFSKDWRTWNYVVDGEYSLQFDMTTFSHESEQIKQYCLGFQECVRCINKEWFDEPTLVSLMMAILLFYGEIPNLDHSHIVKLDQQMYFYLLQRYISQKLLSEDKSSELLSQLMTSFNQVHKIYHGGIRFPPNYNQYLTPFVREIFGV